MMEQKTNLPPRWMYVILEVGAIAACGVYLGMMRVEGVTTVHALKAAAFGAMGLLMLWGVLGRR